MYFLLFLYILKHDTVEKVSQNEPPEMFYKTFFLDYFAEFTGKHFCWNLFLITFQASCEISQNTFGQQLFVNNNKRFNFT